MKKNFLALLLLVTMLFNVLALSSCGLFGGDETGEEEGKINITFYHTMGANLRAVLDLYIEEFEKAYPFINVIHEQVGGYDDVRDTISTELTVGEHPNLAYCYPDHVALYNVAKAVTVLDSYIDFEGEYTFKPAGGESVTISDIGLTQAQKDDFIQAYYNEGKQFGDGKMYTMPLSKSTEVLYYNVDFFTENNLTVPTTWDEMEAVCAQIKAIEAAKNAEIEAFNATCTNEKDKKKLLSWFPLGYDSEANWFITMCEQLKTPYTSATGDKFLFDTEANHAFVKKFCDWHAKGYVTTQEIYGAYTSGLFVSTTESKSFMSIGSSAGATHQAPDDIDFEVGIAPIPQADKTNNKVISQGPSLCIFEDANKDEVMASWLFVKFLTTNIGFQAEFSEASGYVPVIKSVTNDEHYKEFLASANGYNDGIAALSAKVCLEQESYYYTSPAFNGSSTARDQVGILLQNCLVNCAPTTDKNGNTVYKTDAEMMKIITDLFDKAIYNCEYNTNQQ